MTVESVDPQLCEVFREGVRVGTCNVTHLFLECIRDAFQVVSWHRQLLPILQGAIIVMRRLMSAARASSHIQTKGDSSLTQSSVCSLCWVLMVRVQRLQLLQGCGICSAGCRLRLGRP